MSAFRYDGRRADEGLPLARLHLGDLPLVQDDPADELDVEVPLSDRPLRRLADGGERLGQDLGEDVLLELLAHVLVVSARRRESAIRLRNSSVFPRSSASESFSHSGSSALISGIEVPRAS